MTPWGIRNRIRNVLGLRSGSSVEQVTLKLRLPDGSEHEVRCEPGYTLTMASQTLETPIATGCPDGGCGNCAVDVLEATGLKEPAAAEKKLLEEKKYAADVRLACHARVQGSGARVKVRTVWKMEQTA